MVPGNSELKFAFVRTVVYSLSSSLPIFPFKKKKIRGEGSIPTYLLVPWFYKTVYINRLFNK